ncbi:MAG: Ig-like domain-containing protein [Bacilli bacterium]|nr:Ig-like domain-containing protein [Bacilli bacterium]
MNNDEEEYKVEEDHSYDANFETDSNGDTSEKDSKKNIMKIGLWVVVGFIVFLLILVVFVSKTGSNDADAVSNEKSITLARGDKMAIEHNSDTFSWNSSDKEVAIVTEDGQIEALKEGDATITIKIDNTTYIIKVHVEGSSIVVTDIKLDTNKLELHVDDVYEFTTHISPEEAKDVELSWHSSNEKVVTVDNGKIKAVGVGSSTITVKTGNGYTDICTVQVTNLEDEEDEDITNINLDVSSIILKSGIEYTLDYSIEPRDAKTKLNWESSDPNVATVENGVIKTLAPGTTAITVSKSNKEATCYLTVVKGDSSTPDVIDDGKEVKAVSINVNQAELSLKVGASYAIVPEVLPSNTTNKEVTYKSADEKIATVAADGKVTAVAEGETTITVTAASGVYNTVKVVVSSQGGSSDIETISLSLKSVTLSPGGSVQLYQSYSPSDANASELIWTSSNPGVASVDNGLIVAISPGTTTITVSNGDGVESSCVVDVSSSAVTVENISIIPSSVSLKVNGATQLTVEFYPGNATNKTITWSSSNRSVATVDSNGLVTAKGTGNAIIYAKSSNGIVGTAVITVG